MNYILKFKWLIAIVMIALTAALFVVAPNLTDQAEEAGILQLPGDADSQKAAEILEKAGADAETISLVFALDEPVNEENKQTITSVSKQIKELDGPITNITVPFENKEATDQLVSKDEKTILMPISVDGTEEEINQLADQIKTDILPDDLTTYITGEAIINHDVNESSQEGLERTEIITVILIFVLLLAVFRSIVTPFIPLLAVGITYLLSQSLVSFFIDWFDFPVSNYTQIFLVAVLFGIGTDYCILLLSRYKEELTQGHTTETAIINTYKTAGRTLLISGIAVFIGFLAIGFAEFTIFKSAVGVAVGIAVLMVVLFTIMPFFMAVLKDKLFWPSKQATSHKDSKLWKWFSRFSVLRPIWSLVVVAIITVPFLLTYNGQLSFNTVDEIGDGYDSVKGLNAIEEGFGKGESLPLTVIIKSDHDLVTRDFLPYVESLSRQILKNDNVDSIRTITRPTGDVIEDLYADNQLLQVADGLQQTREGLNQATSQPSAMQSSLGKLQQGLASSENMIRSMGESDTLSATGVFIPEGTLDNAEFQPAIDRYAFDKEKGIKIEVVLKNDPYSQEAIDTTESIKELVGQQVKDTPLEDTTIAYSGISSTNEDLAEISQGDFTRTMIIMLVGLFVVLTILFRSMIMPLYMIGSLLLTYYTSVSIAEKIFVNLLNYEGITWAVPFFGFVMLVALGVDYSIFLLDRFNEEAQLDVKEAMATAMAKMGTVVITAAIILAGTFGAMVPSGVLSLIQIATIVITGLLLYGLIILPLLIPAITVSFGKGVWWPFKQNK